MAATIAFKGYTISPHYRWVCIAFYGTDHRRVSVRTVRPSAALTRAERYIVTRNALIDEGIMAPVYQEKPKGRK